MEVPTVKEYKDALKHALSPRQIETLQVIYSFPNASATAKELALALNYSGFQAANRQIGQLGKTISLYLGLKLPTYEDRGRRPAYYYVIGEYNEQGWNMRKPLQRALEQLNLATDNESEYIERLPTETFQLEDEKLYKEGKVVQVYADRFERNRSARRACIRHHGNSCYACGFNFGQTYGTTADGFIHIHHLTPLSGIGKAYRVDPIQDLVPLCANCHSVVHLTKPVMTIAGLKKLLKGIKKNNK